MSLSFRKFITKVLLNSPLVRSNTVVAVGRLLRSISSSDHVEIEGRKMFVHGNDGLALSLFKVYEPAQTQVVKKYVKEGNVVVDIGAHVGYYTLLFAQLVGQKGKVYAFEPDPVNFELLKKSVEVNGYQNVTIIQKAVSDKNSKVKLYLGDNNRAINRIYDAKMNDTQKVIEVDSVRLDDYFKNHEGEIDFIKMDVEGSETSVIDGMPSILQKTKTLKIITEFYPYLIRKFGKEPEEFVQSLLTAGFKVYDILDDKNGGIYPLDLSSASIKSSQKKEYVTNLLCMNE